jgi:type II secretory pathway predicted ATPase ExeA
MTMKEAIERYNAQVPESGIRKITLRDIKDFLQSQGVTVSRAGLSQFINGQKFKSRKLNEDVAVWLKYYFQQTVLPFVKFNPDRMFGKKSVVKESNQPAPGAASISSAAASKEKKEGADMLKPVYVDRTTLKEFGLLYNPFEAHPDEIFMNGALEDVKYAIKDLINKKKFIAVTGPIGSGKTTLMHEIETELEKDENNYIIRPQIFAPAKTTESSLIEAMIRDMSEGAEIVRGNYEKKANALGKMFSEMVPQGRNFIVIIDNAHELPDRALKFLKRIYDREVKLKKLVSIVLVGQVELDQKLRNNHELSEVSQRIVPIHLPSYAKFIAAYLEARAGKEFVQKYIDADAIKVIMTNVNSSITPLFINNLICRAMKKKRENAAPKITPEIIKLAFAA